MTVQSYEHYALGHGDMKSSSYKRIELVRIQYSDVLPLGQERFEVKRKESALQHEFPRRS